MMLAGVGAAQRLNQGQGQDEVPQVIRGQGQLHPFAGHAVAEESGPGVIDQDIDPVVGFQRTVPTPDPDVRESSERSQDDKLDVGVHRQFLDLGRRPGELLPPTFRRGSCGGPSPQA